mmetsp:Transcript_28339/g.34646  ORF Transcript_28339/g.34646 Transcript_28339/m.34646 type:complete len:137 (-) Transcript_28339:121-531(-)
MSQQQADQQAPQVSPYGIKPSAKALCPFKYHAETGRLRHKAVYGVVGQNSAIPAWFAEQPQVCHNPSQWHSNGSPYVAHSSTIVIKDERVPKIIRTTAKVISMPMTTHSTHFMKVEREQPTFLPVSQSGLSQHIRM